MGQALDRDGNVLGEAEWDSVREVLDRLSAEHKEAFEFRIRQIEKTQAAQSSMAARQASVQMPKYRCHKEVWALKILGIGNDPSGGPTDGSGLLVVETPYAPIRVSGSYMKKHQPMLGGYFVQYEDGYQSYSPAAAFESGYTRIEA